MLIRLLCAVLVLVLLPACAMSRARTMPGSSGGGGSPRGGGGGGGTPTLVECNFGRAGCYEEAARICPNGYDIVDSSATVRDSSWTGESGSILITCSRPTVGARAEAEKAADRKRERLPLRDAPVGAGGFQFGDTPSDAELFCREAENSWLERDNLAVCGGTAIEDTDSSTKTVLEFCDDFLCKVTLRFSPNSSKKSEKAWIQELTRLRTKLIQKYGQWTSSKTPPNWCRRDVLKCLANGDAKYRYQWSWPTGERILLKLQNKKDSKLGPTIKVVYSTPKRGTADVL
jgi:hypothetical protein